MTISATSLTIDSIATLRTITVAAAPLHPIVVVESYLAGLGLGGGPFFWNATDSRADDAGWIINPTGNAGNGRWNRIALQYQLEHFGAQPTSDYTQTAIGTANVTAFNAAIAATPTGNTLFWSSGPLLIIGGGLSWSRRVGFVCSTSQDYVLPALVNTTDAVTFAGAPTDDLDFVINVAGLSNNCRDAIVIENLISPRRAWFRVQSDPARYGLNIQGIENASDVRYMATNNFADYPNQSIPTVTHVNITASAASIGTNASRLWVDISGGGNGITGNAGVSDAGDVKISGVIQGITGNPMVLTNMQGFTIDRLHLEANSGYVQFTGCSNFTVRDMYSPNKGIYVTGCLNYGIENVQGTLVIDAASASGWDRNTTFNTSDTFVCSSPSHQTMSGIPRNGSTVLYNGGNGAASARTLSTNGLINGWPGGASSPPSEWTGASTTWAQVISAANCFVGNPSTYYAATVTSTLVLANCPSYTPSIPYVTRDSEYVSIMIALNPSGTDAQAWIDDGVGPQLIGVATNGGGWQVIRGSMKVAGSAAWKVRVVGTVVSQTIYIGGIAWCRGPVSPQFLQ